MVDIRERHVTELVRVISEIVGGQVGVLQRVERAIAEQIKAYAAIVEKLDLVDKKTQGGFTVLENTRLASIDKNVMERLANIDYRYLMKLKHDLDVLNQRLQQQVNAQLLELLIKQARRPVKSAGTILGRGRSSNSVIEAGAPYVRDPILSPVGPQPQIPSIPAEEVKVPEGDWMESEMEGAQIFDSIIVGWKRRDWEDAKGTREIFMRAWRKLSSSDKQKIRNGAWSKPIITKMKLLGRE